MVDPSIAALSLVAIVALVALNGQGHAGDGVWVALIEIIKRYLGK